LRDIYAWSKTGETTSDLVRELLAERKIRRAPRHWLPSAIRPPLRHRRKIDQAVRLLVHERDGWRCLHCGTGERLTLDHVVPWSLGGSDGQANLQTLCTSCNCRKGARV
jgi:5-methylcytosine-specific restriction endonuclease McrA